MKDCPNGEYEKGCGRFLGWTAVVFMVFIYNNETSLKITPMMKTEKDVVGYYVYSCHFNCFRL